MTRKYWIIGALATANTFAGSEAERLETFWNNQKSTELSPTVVSAPETSLTHPLLGHKSHNRHQV